MKLISLLIILLIVYLSNSIYAQQTESDCKVFETEQVCNTQNVVANFQEASCGNGKCESGENSCNCSTDCGNCSGKVPGLSCTEYACTENKICSFKKILGCCGNNACESGENYVSCKSDCLPKSLSIELISPTEALLRGEKAVILVKVLADGSEKANSANVKVSGFFGEKILFNDGKHEDGTAYDAEFANEIEIDSNALDGTKKILVEAEFLGIRAEKEFELKIETKLSIELTEVKEQYFLGDIISVNGKVLRKQKPVAMKLNVSIGLARPVFETIINSNENGEFETSYHLSLIDLEGNWKVKVNGEDEFKNHAEIEKSFTVTKPKKKELLEIQIINDLSSELEKEKNLELSVKVKNEEGQELSDSNVLLITPKNEEIKLKELVKGNYSVNYFLKHDLVLGENKFKLIAQKEDENVLFEGSKEFSVNLKKAKIKIDLIEPKELYYKIGEKIPLRLILSYESGELITEGKFNAIINDENVELKASRRGEFIGEYYVKEKDLGEKKVLIEFQDSYLNSGLIEKRVIVSEKSPFLILQENAIYIVIGLALAIVIFGVAIKTLKKSRKKTNLVERKKELEELIKELDKKYFIELTVKKEDYGRLKEQYSEELKQIEEELSVS